MKRVAYVVHQSQGRLRLRLGWLREKPNEGDAIADHLSRLDGMEEVEVRPFTGSVLCLYDPTELDDSRILDALRAFTRADQVVLPGEESPAEVEGEIVRLALFNGSEVARAATRMFEELDLGVLRATRGSVNLGTLAAMGFLAAGATQVARRGKLPLPPWFNLAWWAFRTFMISERKVIDDERAEFTDRIEAAAKS
ncbi:HMA2 domain-containing protein [Vulgatibacter incomptus]|uniref:Uncharacterized protein n=1 Tax=Vulgatibacter incomptus TaxID=1391653 RepID=A0A0K1PF41_9BACT|nr:hypothetical protein [Vulgatibacter incomptus]AKU92041.1 hypothetical protein AKJ08_2428 [Vulgatibacter incomptus]